MRETLKQVLMRRDNHTPQEAKQLINEMQKRVSEGESPEEILYEIGLEPDYVFEILP